MDAPNVVAYFQRHGSTELNNSGKFRGSLDPDLDQHGMDDAKSASQFFAPIQLGDAYSSDKKRAESTATAILQPKGLTYESDPRLRSWNVGFLAGQPKADHKDDIEYFQRHPDAPVPGGESLNQFKQRVRPSIHRSIGSGIQKGTPSLTVAHSSVLKEVSSLIHGNHNHENVDPGGIIGVTHDPKTGQLGVKALFKKRGGKHGMGE